MKSKLFGEAAVEKGYVTEAELAQALTEQDRASAQDHRYRFVGEILVELGFMSELEVLDVLNAIHDHHAAP